MWRPFLLRSSLSILFLFPALTAAAQTADRAELTGRVTDDTGSALPGVSLVLINDATGHQHLTTSNDRGDFAYPYLPPGRYSLTAELPHFSPLKMKGIRLAVNQALELSLVLKVGGPETSVTVTAEGKSIDTNNPAIKYRLTGKQIEDLPLIGHNLPLVGRNLFQSIAFLVPGASGPELNPGTAGLHLNGSPTGGVAFSVDGIDNTSMGNWAFANYAGGALSPGPNPDAVQEFSATTQNFKADSGTRPTLVNLETKSGGNQFHGQIRGLLFDPSLAARDFFDTGPKSTVTTKMFGTQLSGPVYIPGLYRGRNKTFFFVDQESTWFGQFYGDEVGQTLSERERKGDFSDLPPDQWPVDPLTGAPFPGGRIPAERVVPQSRFFVNAIITPPTQGSEVHVTDTAKDQTNDITTRLDHQFSHSDTINGSFFWQKDYYTEPYTPWVQDSVSRVPTGGRNLAIHHTHAFTPAAVNSLSFGTSGAWHQIYLDGKFNNVDLQQEGFNIVRNTQGRTGYPNVTIEDVTTFQPGGTDYE